MAGFVHILPKIGLKQPSIFYLSHQQTANTNTHTHITKLPQTVQILTTHYSGTFVQIYIDTFHLSINKSNTNLNIKAL